MENIALIITLLFGITLLAVLCSKFNFPFPIVLVLAGVAISLIPGLPAINLKPEIIFLIFLPPLLHDAAWNTNWHNFKENKRNIILAAFGVVLFTTVLVGIAAHLFIPGMSWSLGFLLGAIVSPTDAVGAIALTKKLHLPRKVITILEGESMVNDASGLVAYKYGVAAVMSGNFIFWQAGLDFLFVIVGSIAIGIIIAHVGYLLLKFLIVDPILVTAFSFLVPFAGYLIAEHFECSGVLAVVCAGLYLSYKAKPSISNEARITIYATWDVITFILNSLIFILIGLQLRTVMKGISNYSNIDLIFYALLVSAAVIIARFMFVVPAALLPRKISRTIRENETFSSNNMFLIGWAGIRGVISLAAALALPLVLPGGAPFPERNLIIFLTFCVIFITLVLLGLNLPLIIRTLKIKPYSIVEEEYEVRNVILKTTIDHINNDLSHIENTNLDKIKYKYDIKYQRIQKTDLPDDYFENKNRQHAEENVYNRYSQLEVDVLKVERDSLVKLENSGKVSEEIFRKIQRELDLEESRIRMEMHL
jgi:Na+/H+ antiporter